MTDRPTKPSNTARPHHFYQRRSHKIRILSTLAISSFAIAALAFASPDQQSQQDEFTSYNDRYNEISQGHDLEAFIQLYGATPLWIAPYKPPVSGLDVPRNTFGFITKQKGTLVHSFDHLYVSDDGSQAVMIGQYDIEIESMGQKGSGTYLFVLERDAEHWRIVVDMFNEHSSESS